MVTTPLAARPIRIGPLTLGNRIVGTAHASGVVRDGLPLRGDDVYWRRLAAGGASMLVVGGTVVSPHSAPRSGIVTEAWRPEVVPGLAARAKAIRDEGVVAACQLVHLGRETLGAEIWRHPVAPSAVRSPREFGRPRELGARDLDSIVEDFRVSAHHAAVAGFQVVELHAAHGYLLAQFLSPNSNTRDVADPMLDGVQLLRRIAAAIRATDPELTLGVRISAEGEQEAGLSVSDLTRMLPELADFSYTNVTVGVRTTYVRDMATVAPPLLSRVAELAAGSPAPLLISHSFRRGADIEQALGAGADLVGVARPLIADPDFPLKIVHGREAAVRPCTSCNEDCRAFDPVLLCSVNPDLAPPGHAARPAEPHVVRAVSAPPPKHVAVVGAGPAGLEAALRLSGKVGVTVFEKEEQIGGQLLTAANAPHRSGWGRLLDYYDRMLGEVPIHLGQTVGPECLADFDEVIVATGAHEQDPTGFPGAVGSTAALRAGASGLTGTGTLLVADDGSNGWPTVSAVETGAAAGCRVIIVTPAAGFAAGIPPEPRVQLLKRLHGADVEIHTMTALSRTAIGCVTVRNGLSGAERTIEADRVVVVGERIARPWTTFGSCRGGVQVIGDALVPRKVAHALAEGRAAAAAIVDRLEADV